MNAAQIRSKEFSSVKGIYLNHAGVSPLPNRTVSAVQEAVVKLASDPVNYFMSTAMPAHASARLRLARLMGVPPEHMAFTKNTGHGLSIVADSLIAEPGDNVVCVGIDYPAVVYPWKAQEWRGIGTRLVAARPDGTFTAEDLAAACDSRTRAVAVSWVQFGTGFRADVRSIVEMSHALGAICVVDVIQGLGALRYNNAETGADIVATGAHKWLLSPSGTGGLYVSPEVVERMNLVNIAAVSAEDPWKFDSTVFKLKSTIQRVEEGSSNALGLIGLDASLSLIEEAGIEWIEGRVLDLAKATEELLEAKGYQITSPRTEDARSGIVMFGHPTHANDQILAALTEHGVTAAERGGKIRFAPHLYNTVEEIEQAVEALPQ